ncbi:unnamed protein product, partial [Orchesella dallaii]
EAVEELAVKEMIPPNIPLNPTSLYSLQALLIEEYDNVNGYMDDAPRISWKDVGIVKM